MASVAPLPSRPLARRPNARHVVAKHPLRHEIRANSPLSLSTFPSLSSNQERPWSPLIPKASVGNVEYTVEPGTNVSFPRELKIPGCIDSLVLLGTGYREKVFAILGVKVYAAGFYVECSIREILDAWKGKPATDIMEDLELFNAIFKGITEEQFSLFIEYSCNSVRSSDRTAPMEKSLRIELVRDVDGKTFWNALNEALSPRVKEPTAADESALSTFHNTFQGRDLKKGTFIYLTWVQPSKMLVSISSDGSPSNVNAEIESLNVNLALYDAFLGNSPVSPTLKASIADGLLVMLNLTQI